MQINYLDAISSVLNMMKQPDSACKNIDMHRTCYTTLFKYLMDKGMWEGNEDEMARLCGLR